MKFCPFLSNQIYCRSKPTVKEVNEIQDSRPRERLLFFDVVTSVIVFDFPIFFLCSDLVGKKRIILEIISQ